MEACFARVKAGFERRLGDHMLARHRHAGAYVSLVLAGGYEEAGDAGRFRARPGDVLIHAPFEAHLDRFMPCGADILNLPLCGWDNLRGAFGEIGNPDAIARAAERDVGEALDKLHTGFKSIKPQFADWPDVLVEDILCDPDLRLSEWAARHRLAPTTLSRGFRKVFGLSPSTFRAQARARKAWRELISDDIPLSALAADTGFADQPHMTRAIGALTGRTPAQWRKTKSNRFKTST